MSPKYPLVSVIIPSYGHEKYIRKTLESIVNQSFKNIELIVIDDASKDTSKSIIQEFSQKTKITCIFKPKNKGFIDSLNIGLKIATGKYVAPCASDDFWHSEKIFKQVERLEREEDLKAIFTEGWDVDHADSIIGKIKYSNRHLEKYYFEDVLLKADLPPASFMARREDMLEVGGYSLDFKIEDLPMWLMLLRSGGYASVIRENLSFYRSHDNNMHNVFSTKVLDQHYAIVDKFSDGLKIRKKVLREWRLRNANFLASTNKKASFEYLKPVLHCLHDKRLYTTLLKYLFK